MAPSVAVSRVTGEIYGSLVNAIKRFPEKMNREEFYPVAYQLMYLSRQMDEKFRELFRKGHAKGTVTQGNGNEATTVGMAMPFRPGKDVATLLHRDLAAHLIFGAHPYTILCQYMANAASPTHGREGNVHYGDVKNRRFPMISHLGDMLAPAVGGVWGARTADKDVFGLTIIGDGGTSTGDFHESLNLASVQRVPVLFMIENNNYAYSTPVSKQFNCKKLSDRALGYGITGVTIDGTDVWQVYNAVCTALDTMSKDPQPYIIESMTLRLEGHAVYDKAEYVPAQERAEWMKREPMMRARESLQQVCGYSEDRIAELELNICNEIEQNIQKALKNERPDPTKQNWNIFADRTVKKVKPFKEAGLRNLNAINSALDYILASEPNAFIVGQDIGAFGSAFKSCKGLIEKYGPDRVKDMPICESATVGFCLGASQTGTKPIMEFQFADFGTEAVTQLGLNSGTWFFRSGMPAQLLMRFPCGGGITLGAFHSGEFDGLWSRFPGLKLFYPATPQECFEATIAAFYDPNPCLVFEHKALYWGKPQDVDFDGDLENVYRPRKYTEGTDLTIVAMGAMVDMAIGAISTLNYSAEVWNPFILVPSDLEPVIQSVRKTGRLLVVQESAHTAGMGSNFIQQITKQCFSSLKCAPELISTPDTPVPFAKELETYFLPNQDKISTVIKRMMEG